LKKKSWSPSRRSRLAKKRLSKLNLRSLRKTLLKAKRPSPKSHNQYRPVKKLSLSDPKHRTRTSLLKHQTKKMTRSCKGLQLLFRALSVVGRPGRKFKL